METYKTFYEESNPSDCFAKLISNGEPIMEAPQEPGRDISKDISETVWFILLDGVSMSVEWTVEKFQYIFQQNVYLPETFLQLTFHILYELYSGQRAMADRKTKIWFNNRFRATETWEARKCPDDVGQIFSLNFTCPEEDEYMKGHWALIEMVKNQRRICVHETFMFNDIQDIKGVYDEHIPMLLRHAGWDSR